MTKQISFEDIHTGDRLRVEHAWAGIEFTREGVAHENTRDGWYTSEGGLLITADSEATITLVDRPEPQEPEGVGVVVETKRGVQMVSTHPHPGGSRWVRLWREGRGTSEFATARTWDYLVRAHGNITVVREGV